MKKIGKKRIDWLKEFPEGVQDKIMANVAEEYRTDVLFWSMYEVSKEDFILGMFKWDSTPEGMKYWEQIYLEIQG